MVNKRIGIFEYDWSLYSFIKDLSLKLAEAGYSVDIFFKDTDIKRDYARTDEFKIYENIRFYDFTTRQTKSQVIKIRFKKLLNLIALFFALKIRDKADDIIDKRILKRSREIIGKSQYSFFIGIEKKGLIWAGIMSETVHCPVIYYSLELYLEDHPYYFKGYHLRDAEKRYHQLSIATLIQDSSRANALLVSNEVKNNRVLYYPVSVKGAVIQKKSNYLQNKFEICENKKILLYFGEIYKSRYATQIVNMARDLEEDIILVMHGQGPKRYLDYLQSIADKEKVIFSLEFVPETEIVDLISSAHIGISLYGISNANDKFTAFSSSKMAYYAQCGVPFIAFNTESYRGLVDNCKCGELINSVKEIPHKVHDILANYESYKKQAFLAYRRFYNLDDNFSRLLPQIERVIDE